MTCESSKRLDVRMKSTYQKFVVAYHNPWIGLTKQFLVQKVINLKTWHLSRRPSVLPAAGKKTRSIWKMLGPFATRSRRTPHCHSPGVALSHAACASMSMTTTTTRNRGDRYGPIEWAQLNIFRLRAVVVCRQDRIDKYYYYIRLRMETPEPTSFVRVALSVCKNCFAKLRRRRSTKKKKPNAKSATKNGRRRTGTDATSPLLPAPTPGGGAPPPQPPPPPRPFSGGARMPFRPAGLPAPASSAARHRAPAWRPRFPHPPARFPFPAARAQFPRPPTMLAPRPRPPL